MAGRVISHATLHFLLLAQFKWQEKCLQEPWCDIIHREGLDLIASEPTHDNQSIAWSRHQPLHVKNTVFSWGRKGWKRRTWNFCTYLANGEAGKALPRRKTWVQGSRFCREEGGSEIDSCCSALINTPHGYSVLSARMPPPPLQKVINGIFLLPLPELPTAPEIITSVIGSGI